MSNPDTLLDQVFRCMLQAHVRGENYLAVARMRFPSLSEDLLETVEAIVGLFKDGHIEASLQADGQLRFRAVVRAVPN